MARTGPTRSRPPRLVRLTKILKRASLVVFVLFILYLATVAYSFGNVAKDLQPSGGSNKGTFGFVGSSTIRATQTLNVSNSGLYPLTLGAGVVIYTASGIILGQGSTPSTGIPSRGSGQLGLGVSVSVAPGSPGQALLTNSETLEFGIWVNATVGWILLVPVSVHFVQNQSWGAPFMNAVVTASVAGGEASVTLAFQNHASFSLAGLLAFQVLTPGGVSCGTGSFGVSTPSGQPFGQTAQVPTPCASLTGDSFVATLSGGVGSPFSVQLPPIPVEA
ncbi:MAG TPA: hypothetical protein VMV28_03990 [Thermoplasmata archaeon]|nr:hypothetical protein [Thermoplasmata archaeon]